MLVVDCSAAEAGAVDGPPHGLGLRLDAGDGVYDQHGPVEDGDAAVDLHGKVYVTWGVDEVDGDVAATAAAAAAARIVPAPVEADGGALDCDPPLPLGRKVVRDGAARVDRPRPPHDAGQGQHPLRHGGLSRIDVRQHAHVAKAGKAPDLGGVCALCAGAWGRRRAGAGGDTCRRRPRRRRPSTI